MPTPPPAPLNHDRICFECVGEAFLKDLIQREGTPDACSYCRENGPTISIAELADHIERAFEYHYERTSPGPDGWECAMISDRESDYCWERSGEPANRAILNALDVEEDVADAVLSILGERHYDHYRVEVQEECEFCDEAHYQEKSVGNGEFSRLWNDFERGLKTEARYFSRSAQFILEQIFSEIGGLQTTHPGPVVVEVGPSKGINAIFRARVFAGECDKLKEALKEPWQHLGTPPSDAAGAGRMNARGIAVFYGAMNAATALAEVRPPVGSQVAVARFHILRDLRLLDLSALRNVFVEGSIFNPETIKQMQKANFLQILSLLMSRAIMPNEEASEYLPTQAVAEYLGNEVGLDGMIFPSIQSGQSNSNVVLFRHASRVEHVELSPGTRLEASLESTDSDGVHPEYVVWETIPTQPQTRAPGRNQDPLSLASSALDETSDHRPDTLEVELESIEVFHIDSVNFGTVSHPVIRHRMEEPNYRIKFRSDRAGADIDRKTVDPSLTSDP